MSESDDERNLRHPKWSRAQSPVPAEYANMSPEKLERILGTEIPRAPSWSDRARSYLGFETNPPYDPTALRSARRAAHSRDSRKAKLRGQHEDKMRESAAAEKRADDAREAAKEAAIRHKLEIQRLQDAAKAAKERARFPRNPITKNDIWDAQMNYEDLRVAAQGSATTDRFVPPQHAYDVLGKNRDAARERWEKLKEKFAEQERETPGAQFVPPVTFRQGSVFGIPPRPGARGPEGGKSKRVKSKRNKRSTKRRNARK